MNSLASTSGAGSAASGAPVASPFARPAKIARIDRPVSAALLALGAVLWWTSHNYAARMPVWGPWEFSWGWYLAAAFGLWWYATGLMAMPRDERPA